MPINAQRNDDLLDFIDDDVEPAAKTDASWRVLLVDDDDDVHESTSFALRDITILDRPIQLVHAHSAAEARERIGEFGDVAVALIDVVMEAPDAGLQLVHDLREAGLEEMRIVLRTGQPGYAPELSVVSRFQIDDYRTKAELTRTRLITVLTSTIRAYNQLCTINHSRAGLEMIVESSNRLFQRTNMERFSWGILTQIAALLQITPKGVVCVSGCGQEPDSKRIVSAIGQFAGLVGRTAAEIPDPVALSVLRKACRSMEPVAESGYFGLRISSQNNAELTALIQLEGELAETDLSLLKLFSSNITIAFENLSLVERLDDLAFIDSILQVPNLNAFDAALQEHAGGEKQTFRLALLQVEAFNSILVDHGLQTAVHYLRQVYEALRQSADATTVARIGDSTFAMLGDETSVRPDAIAAVFKEPYRVDGVEIAAHSSSVILDFDEAKNSTANAMRDAISALSHVRHTRRGNCVRFDDKMRAEIQRRNRLLSALKGAVEHGDDLMVHVQPKVDMATDECIGVEALLRWKLDDEMISPAEFIPIAETSGLTQPLTDFVIDQVGHWLRGRETDERFSVAVNLSMDDLNHPGFAARLLRQVEKAGLRSGQIEFEVTEGIARRDTPWAVDQVRMLREAGHLIALDDFGTGYSSLDQFDSLPIDVLKIDRSFVKNLNVQTARHSLAAIVLTMARTLNVGCVAEGIETEEQKQALRSLGCEVGQGFLLGRPQPFAEFDRAWAGR